MIVSIIFPFHYTAILTKLLYLDDEKRQGLCALFRPPWDPLSKPLPQTMSTDIKCFLHVHCCWKWKISDSHHLRNFTMWCSWRGPTQISWNKQHFKDALNSAASMNHQAIREHGLCWWKIYSTVVVVVSKQIQSQIQQGNKVPLSMYVLNCHWQIYLFRWLNYNLYFINSSHFQRDSSGKHPCLRCSRICWIRSQDKTKNRLDRWPLDLWILPLPSLTACSFSQETPSAREHIIETMSSL